MRQGKTNPENGLRALIDELYARIGKFQSMVSGIVANAIIFRPGGVPGGDVVTTWSGVQSKLAAADGLVDIYVDDSIEPAIVPSSSGVTDGRGATTLIPYTFKIQPTLTQLIIEDGAQLKDFQQITGPMNIVCQCGSSGVPSIGFSYSFGLGVFFELFRAATIIVAGTISPIQVPTGSILGIICFVAVNIQATATVPVVALAPHSFLAILAFDTLNWSGEPPVSGDATTTWQLQRDDTVFLPPAGFGGNFQDNMSSDAANEAYEPHIGGNWNPTPTTVAQGLDQLAAPNVLQGANTGVIGPSGAVAFNPPYPLNSITQQRSGLVRAFGQLSASGGMPGTSVAFTLFRDGSTVLATGTQDVGANGDVSCSLEWIDTLPGGVHFYQIQAIAAAGTLTVNIGNSQIVCNEL